MFSIENNNIFLTRGDTLLLKLDLIKDGKSYIPQQGDSIRFAMKRKYSDDDSDVILVKDIPINDLILQIDPEDTKPLPMRSKYVYDIQYTDSVGRVDTFIQGIFTIGEEVL